MCSTNHVLSEIHDVSVYANFLASLFAYSSENNCYAIGDWIEINAYELQEQVKNNPSYPYDTEEDIRRHFIALLIRKVNSHHYDIEEKLDEYCELHASRQQQAMFGILQDIPLSSDEATLIKYHCDYDESLSPSDYIGWCQCGNKIHCDSTKNLLTGEVTCFECDLWDTFGYKRNCLDALFYPIK